MAGTSPPRPATLKAIQDAIEAAEVQLIPVNGSGEGVRQKEPRPLPRLLKKAMSATGASRTV